MSKAAKPQLRLRMRVTVDDAIAIGPGKVDLLEAIQALVRAEARTQAAAQAFLNAAREAGLGLDPGGQVALYAAVPMALQRVANVERAQLLVESGSRPALQRFLAAWQPVLQGLREPGLIRWAVDVDPLAV